MTAKLDKDRRARTVPEETVHEKAVPEDTIHGDLVHAGRRETLTGQALAGLRLTSPSNTGERRGIDQRREPRRPAQGIVRIVRGETSSSAENHNTTRTEIAGRLIDISSSGFRAAHACAAMTSGEIVRYSHARGEGQARVVWTRVTTGADPAVESGFMVLAET